MKNLFDTIGFLIKAGHNGKWYPIEIFFSDYDLDEKSKIFKKLEQQSIVFKNYERTRSGFQGLYMGEGFEVRITKYGSQIEKEFILYFVDDLGDFSKIIEEIKNIIRFDESINVATKEKAISDFGKLRKEVDVGAKFSIKTRKKINQYGEKIASIKVLIDSLLKKAELRFVYEHYLDF